MTTKASRIPCSSAANTVLSDLRPMYVERVTWGRRHTAAAPTLPFMPLPSVYIAVGCGGLPSILLCCSIAASASRSIVTSGGIQVGSTMKGRIYSSVVI